LRDLGNANSLLKEDDRFFAACSCHMDVSGL
jgi:hypothetical protein